MFKIDIYEEYCLIWLDNLDNVVADKIREIIENEGLMYDWHNKSVTVYSPSYSLLYEISVISYILLQ